MKIQTTPKKLFTVSALSIGAIMFAQEQDSLRTKSIDDVVITGNANRIVEQKDLNVVMQILKHQLKPLRLFLH